MKKASEKLAEEWFEKAKSDLLYAKAGEKETGQHHITCFLCHQSCEKCLKGLITLAGEKPPRTNNLALLLGKVLPHHSHLEKLQREIRKLDKYYISARYPDDTYTDFKKEDADQALATAQELLLILET